MISRYAALWMMIAGLGTGCVSASPFQANHEDVDLRTWVDYVAGRDLRTDCVPGRDDRYRLVFSGDSGDQPRGDRVQVFDVIGNNRGATVEAWMLPTDVDTKHDGAERLRRAHAAGLRTHLSKSQFALLRARLVRNALIGADGPVPTTRYMWLVSGCHAGHFFMTLFSFPDDAFSQIDARSDSDGDALPPSR